MVFTGIKRTFSLKNEEQYETIGGFWDEMAEIYGLENLRGLGYGWHGDTIEYAIGLKDGEIDGCNVRIDLPDGGWEIATGRTEDLPLLYDEIYKSGRLEYEIEEFTDVGDCVIHYVRKMTQKNIEN